MNGRSNGNGNGGNGMGNQDRGDGEIELRTPIGVIRGNGLLATILVLFVVVIGSIMWTHILLEQRMESEHTAIVRSLDRVGDGLNDVFVGVLLTQEQKANLPAMVREKAEQKAREKATRKLAAD